MKIVELARFVDDVPAAITFYRHIFGVAPVYADESLATFQLGDMKVLIHRRYEPGPDDLPCEDHLAFGVANVAEAAAQLEQQGLVIAYPPRDYDWGRSAYLREPNGTLIELTVLPAQEPA